MVRQFLVTKGGVGVWLWTWIKCKGADTARLVRGNRTESGLSVLNWWVFGEELRYVFGKRYGVRQD